MTEVEWLVSETPTLMLDHLAHNANGRKLRLFCCACCRLVWSHLLEDELRQAVELSEKYADEPAVGVTLATVADLVYRQNMEDWDNGFVGAPVIPGFFMRSAAVWEAAKEVVRPEGVSSKVASVAGEEDDSGPTTRTNAQLLRDIFGNPFWPVSLDSAWLTSDVLALAGGIYEERAFDRMPILADALQDAGCDNEDILCHCRTEPIHVRGCWVVDLLLGKV